MTEKQFEVVFNGSDFQLRNNENNEELHLTDEKVCYDYIADLLNCFHEENEQLKENCKNYNWYKQYKTLLNENEQLKLQLQNTSAQRDEFYRGARENANRVGKLKKENEQLKKQIGNLEHTRDFCAECCERLEKENKQLKSEIREVRGEYEQLWMRFYDY